MACPPLDGSGGERVSFCFPFSQVPKQTAPCGAAGTRPGFAEALEKVQGAVSRGQLLLH